MQLFHFTPQSNVTAITKEGLRPMIGPRSQQMAETEALVYCFTSRAAAEEGFMNWLGDVFDEDEPLSLIEINGWSLPFTLSSELDWEARIRVPIPPELLVSFTPV